MPHFGDFIVQRNKRFLLFFVQQKISKRCPWKTEFFTIHVPKITNSPLRMLEIAFLNLQISKFSGGAYHQTLLVARVFAAQFCALNYVRQLMASFAMFPAVFKTYEKRYRHFHSKKVLKRHFQFLNLLQIRLISNWTLCCTIQGVIVLVISNQPCASLARLLPELHSSRSNYYYLSTYHSNITHVTLSFTSICTCMFNEPKPVHKTLTEKQITLMLKVEKGFVRVSFSDIKCIMPFGINYRKLMIIMLGKQLRLSALVLKNSIFTQAVRPGFKFWLHFFFFSPRSVTDCHLVSKAHASPLHAYSTWNLQKLSS